jgi:hypothetical protein
MAIIEIKTVFQRENYQLIDITLDKPIGDKITLTS